jgi:hypothetical protein
MNTFEADHADGPEARTPSEMLAVLLEGSVPPQFRYPPKAIVSDCTAVTTVTSSLDSHGVDYFRDLLCREQPPDVRLVLLVHATCPTQEKDLLDLLTLLGTSRLRVWILAVKAWGQRCTWVLCARRDSPVHVLWTSTAGDFGLLRPALDEAHLVTAADPLVVDQFIGWFSRVVAISTPLTPDSANSGFGTGCGHSGGRGDLGSIRRLLPRDGVGGERSGHRLAHLGGPSTDRVRADCRSR